MASAERNYWMFVPHPTKSERYLDPYSGEEISRYAWRKLKAEGGTPQVNPRDAHYQQVLKEYAQEKGISVLQARNKPEFHAILANLETADDAPDSRKSWALSTVGRRQPEWDWAVGETPTEAAA